MRTKNLGFTLIDLILILACVLILSAVILSALGAARARARDAKRSADVRQIQEALRLYHNDCDAYPTQRVALSGQSLSSGESNCKDGGWLPKPGKGIVYMPSAPSAPQPADGVCTDVENQYVYSGGGSSYTISFCLGRQNEDFPAGPVSVP